MKKLFAFLFAMFASISIAFADDSGICGDNLTWSYNSTTHVLTITGSGAMNDFSFTNSIANNIPWYSYGSEITSVSFPNGLTSIGRYAFYGCTGLTSVTIPNSVTSIGYSAFFYCTGLTNVIIGNSVTSIGNQAFGYCSGLTSIDIPSSVTSMGSAFFQCKGLTSVIWNAKNCADFSTAPFSYSKKTITSFVFGGEVEHIPAFICSNMTKLTSITIPNSVTSMGNSAFSGCTGLMSVIIPNSVTSMGNSAFSGCTGLMSVTIPNSVTSMGNSTFSGCTGLKSVTIPNSLTRIGEDAFSGCAGLTSVTIPNSVSSIGEDAFSGCTGLTSIIWNAKNCADFSASPFSSANTITSFAFGSEVEHIPAFLCSDMTKLTSITIPNSVTSMGNSAFSGCTGLMSVTMLSQTPPTLGNDALPSTCKVYVPCGTLEQYKAAGYGNSQYPESEYKLTVNAANGSVNNTAYSKCTSTTITVTPNSGYEFVQWSDGNTDNPRTVEMNEDKILTAEIVPLRSGKCGTNNALTWTYDPDSKALTISGNGKLNSNYTYGVEAPTKMLHVVIKSGVTSIGKNAFSGCTTIESVTIPNSVTSIGNYAFEGCSNIKSVVWDAKNCADFSYSPFTYAKEKITSFVFGSEVEHIPAYLCSRMSGLTSIEIPNSVTSIGEYTFYVCSGLTSIKVESGNATYDSRDNCNAIIETDADTLILGCKNTTIPNSVTSIGGSAFSGCTGLTSINIPESVTSIGQSAFIGCTGLTSIIIGNGLKSIGKWAFNNCRGLTNVTIPNSVTSISDNAFEGCSNLKSVIIGKGVTSIGYGVFHLCTALKNVTINAYFITHGTFSKDKNMQHIFGSQVENYNVGSNISKYAFYGCTEMKSFTAGVDLNYIDTMAFYGCTALKSIVWNAKNGGNYHNRFSYSIGFISPSTIPFEGIRSQITSFKFGSEVEHIPDYLCYGMSSLKSITIPNNVTSIGNNTFEGCTGLTSIIIGNGLKSIGDDAFEGCTGLTSLTLPESLTSIGEYALNQCSNLTTIYSKNPNPPTVYDNHDKQPGIMGLGITKNTNVIVSCTAVDAYNSALVWKELNILCEDSYEIDAHANNSAMGHVDGTSGVTDGAEVTITATPNNGYAFLCWDDGENDASRPVSIYSGESYVALFIEEGQEEQGISLDVSDNSASLNADIDHTGVDSYRLTIYKDGVEIITLTFDANGVLQNIVLHTPSSPRMYASSSGLKFQVSNLEPATTYQYTLDGLNDKGKIVFRRQGEFTTDNATALESVDADGASLKPCKVIENGRIVIIMPDGRKFDANGKQLK